MDLFKLMARIGLDDRDFTKGVDNATKKGKHMSREFQSSFTGSVEKIAGSALKLTGIAAGVVGGLGAIGMSYNNQIEKYTTNFSTMLGSAEAGVAKVEELKKFAAATPLSLEDLSKATQTLLAFGVEANVSTDKLKQLGDIALGDAGKVDSLSRAFGKATALGKLNGEIVQMMVDAGYNPLVDIMAETGETMEEVQKRMSDGQISITELEGALTRATSEGGKFFNGMEAGSTTTQGMISTLKDNVSMKLGELFQGISDLLKEMLPKIIEFVNNIDTDKIIEGVKNAYEWFQKWSPVIAGVATTVLALYGAFKTMAIIDTVKNGVLLLNAAMAANPIVFIVSLIAGLVVALITLWNTNEGFRSAVIEAWNNIKAVASDVFNAIANFFMVTVPDAGRKMVEWFRGLPSLISDALSSLWATMVDIGSNIVKGVWEGIKSMASWLTSKVRNFFGGIVDNVKSVLKIFSPSRVGMPPMLAIA